MSQEFIFDTEKEFLDKLGELSQSGVTHDKMNIITPYPVHGMDEVMKAPSSFLKFFTLSGATSGFMTGLLLCFYSVWVWPIITGGKPLYSVPPFLIIAYVTMILGGALASFVGFIVLAKLPSLANLFPEKEYDNQFVISIETEEEK